VIPDLRLRRVALRMATSFPMVWLAGGRSLAGGRAAGVAKEKMNWTKCI
jgi:hypothetical protein